MQSSSTLDFMQHSAFRKAVDRAATYKCLQAIKAGKLRVVQEHHSPLPTRFTPRMDLTDNPSSSSITAIFELPGVKTEDITLHIRDGNLVVIGQRHSPHINSLASSQNQLPRNPITAADSVASGEMESADSSQNLRIHELRFGTFHRTIPVPDGLKESEVTAGLQDGMLTVTWPRSPAESSDGSGSRRGNVTPPTLFTTAAATSQ